ncbi:MAG: hypothetical protein P9L92_15685 [Candidatus Electryonea clarkiae]|nr:hypothetical protein [Candidatus Electryonea clarkiae]MDP8287266.1 hypothetical protein [Candidatus Electryonea clarkiae]
MKEPDLNEKWLMDVAFDALDEDNRRRVMIIMKDLVTLPHLRYTYVINKDGRRLTRPVGQNGEILSEETMLHEEFFYLVRITEEYLKNLGNKAPAHVTVEMEDETLFVGSAGPLILVAAFDGSIARGYMSMKLTKRISSLRKLFRTLERYR